MKLSQLLKDIEVLKIHADLEMDVEKIVYDSRQVTPGSMFVAVSGFVTDGNRFIPMALEKGAAVIVTATEPQEDIPYVLVRSDRLALAQLGANFYNHPAKAVSSIP